MKVVVALGGNALLQRGQALTAENQRDNVRTAVKQLAAIHENHQLVIAHGNGPQVGLLALMDEAYKPVDLPLDVLVSETIGMIGYVIEQELGNIIPFDDHIVTLLTQVLVDQNDPAYKNPTKFIGPVYDEAEATKIKEEKGWHMSRDGDKFRRVVSSPLPQRIIEINVIKMLVDNNVVVICAGGGGIPVAYDNKNRLFGIEAVIDKDLASGLLANNLEADMFVMLTDVATIFTDFGTANQRAIKSAHPDALEEMNFAAGSMGPKVLGACQFVRDTGGTSAIGQLSDLTEIMQGNAGTIISTKVNGIEYWD